MTGTVDIKRVLGAAMAAAALVVVLLIPGYAQAADDCSSAGSDPTAAQYCPPTEPTSEESEECDEGNGGNSGSNTSGSGCEEQEAEAEAVPVAESSSGGGGSLPFTGADLFALVAVAAAFIAVGVALQRLSRESSDIH